MSNGPKKQPQAAPKAVPSHIEGLFYHEAAVLKRDSFAVHSAAVKNHIRPSEADCKTPSNVEPLTPILVHHTAMVERITISLDVMSQDIKTKNEEVMKKQKEFEQWLERVEGCAIS